MTKQEKTRGDSTLLTISIGNSSISAAIFGPTDIGKPVVHCCGNNLQAVIVELKSTWKSVLPGQAAVVTVKPGEWAPVEKQLAECGVQALLAGRDLNPGVEVDYDPPEAAGMDRIVAARAAAERFPSALVVDAGTAVTVDLVESGPIFRGGAIAPGAAIMAASLTRECSLLPPLTGQYAPQSHPPRATEDAMRFGVYVGYAGMVDRLVAEMLTMAKADLPILATGGGATIWQQNSTHKSHLVPHLLHQGLAAMQKKR